MLAKYGKLESWYTTGNWPSSPGKAEQWKPAEGMSVGEVNEETIPFLSQNPEDRSWKEL